MPVEHLFHAGVWLDECATITLNLNARPLGVYGFHCLSWDQLVQGLAVRSDMLDIPYAELPCLMAEVSCDQGHFTMRWKPRTRYPHYCGKTNAGKTPNQVDGK